MTFSVALLAKTVIVLFLQGPRLNVPTRSAKKKGKIFFTRIPNRHECAKQKLVQISQIVSK